MPCVDVCTAISTYSNRPSIEICWSNLSVQICDGNEPTQNCLYVNEEFVHIRPAKCDYSKPLHTLSQTRIVSEYNSIVVFFVLLYFIYTDLY